jgi:hypothetical protein
MTNDSRRNTPEDLDYEITRPPDEPGPLPPSRRSPVPWIAALIVLVLAGAVWYVMVRGPRESAAPPPEDTSAAAPGTTPPAPLGATPAPVEVPPLDQSDAVVRELVRQLSSHPQVAAWLATDGLIRNFTVVMANVADGATPARHLRALRPSAEFSVTTRGSGLAIDPASYRRYDGIAGAAASLDPAGAARLYSTLKPRIEEAYRDLGHPDTPVDRAVEAAIVRLLQTPTVDDPVLVRRAKQGIGYEFVDPDLESLSPAQKQLLRTGPNNMKTIQDSLRAIAGALGIPPDRLPAPRHIQQRQ